MAPLIPLILSASLSVLLTTMFSTPVFGAVELTEPSPDAAASTFPLVAGGVAAAIVLPPNAPEVVKIAARDLAADVERVTGVRPDVLEEAPKSDRPRVEVTFPPGLEGKWEAFQISATPSVLTIAGSDKRALAFGLYEISRRIGVSPWQWWADVPAVKRDDLHLSAGEEPVDAPAVKYRAIFINDEDWGLHPWAAKTFEPEVGDLGPGTYAKVFELLLRLRGNTIWPAMHEITRAFHLVPGNAAVADRYAIVLGSSHAEPMLRSNTSEWTAPKEDYNYLTNREGVLEYWEERVKERTSGESLFTLGMRGIHDSSIVGPKGQKERIETLEAIFEDQRAMLAKHLGKGDPAKVGQIFVPYKEVLDDYNAGLKVPEDAIIVWPDDNFGYIRRYATDAERQRPGGLGIYYHASYLGSPLSWLWIDSLQLPLIWAEMMRAYEQGARGLWIVNCGDLKAAELSTEFFLHLAWNADRTTPDAPADFLRRVAERDFGKTHAEQIVDIWKRYQALSFARKPEHLQWHLSLKPYRPTELTEQEINERLDSYAALVRDTRAVAEAVPADAQDAFFELVGYPVQAAAAANERYFRAELARLQKARGEEESAKTTFAASESADRQIAELTRRYNEEIAGGKWRHIITAGGVSPKDWKRFQPEPIPPLDSSAQDSVKAPEPRPEPAPLEKPADARPGDFVERGGVVSIDAGHFTSRKDAGDGGWRVIPGLGRTGSAATVLPSSLKITPGDAPRLSYRLHVASGGPARVHVRLLPTHPIVSGQGLRLALALDDGDPLPLAVTEGFEPKSDAWNERVLAGATEATLELPEPLSPGWHTLHLVAVDAGVVVDRIVVDLGGLQPSYDGPEETRLP